MITVHLNGSDPDKIAKLMGGTIIAVNGDSVLIAGGDPKKLKYLLTGDDSGL